jgi:hypothetical protein
MHRSRRVDDGVPSARVLTKEAPVSHDDPGLEAGRQLAGLTLTDLWVDYVGLGGNAAESELHGYLDGAHTPPREHDLVALAINERLADLGIAHRLAFREDLGP